MLIDIQKHQFFNRRINTLDKKQFWKPVKHLNKNDSTIPTLSINDTGYRPRQSKLLILLNTCFINSFNTSLPPLNVPNGMVLPANTYDSIENLLRIEEEVLHLLYY